MSALVYYVPGILTGLLLGYITPRLLRVVVKHLLRRRAAKRLENVSSKKDLSSHTAEFEKQVIEVIPGVHVAVGYALANSIMIDAPEGLIIVDVTESYEAGLSVVEQFRKITDKPIKAIIYTHNHADHCYGAKAFIEDPLNPPEIWAYKTFEPIFKDFLLRINGAAYRRAMRQFGPLLPEVVNSGIGPQLKHSGKFTISAVSPDHFLEVEEQEFTIAGMKIALLHMPGETPDQMCVYLPDRRLLIPADNIYRAFPNLYAIRGTAPRDYMSWVSSLDRMRQLRPEYLVLCHTKPVYGEEDIYDLLTIYRDAIQYVHDQTLRWMNMGYNIDEIVPKVELPPQLASHPFLQPFYGTVPWSVRGCFNNYLGWFSGDPRDLNRPVPKDKARWMVDLAGSPEAALNAAAAAFRRGDCQWSLELSTAVWELNRDDKKAIDIRVDSLKGLASTQTSANGRNYYLTCAIETEGLIENAPSGEAKKWAVNHISIVELFKAMSVKLKGEECQEDNCLYQFVFPDTKEAVALHLRNGIIEILQEEVNNFKFKVTCETNVWRSILLNQTSVPVEMAKGTVQLDGSLADLHAFNDLFVKTL